MDFAASRFAKALKWGKLLAAHMAIWVCRHMPASFYRNAAEFGQSVEFSLWVTRTFGRSSTFFASRQKLWQRMLARLSPGRKVTVFEFGVAYGHATRWWLAQPSAISTWYGFDTFTGLPEAWRHFEAGAFNANGKPPEISDDRLQWVVGHVEDTFSAKQVQETSSGEGASQQRVFLFDMDLHGPTRHVLLQIGPHLQEGDLLYFDEAANMDERSVVAELLQMAPDKFKLIGATPMALALQVKLNASNT